VEGLNRQLGGPHREPAPHGEDLVTTVEVPANRLDRTTDPVALGGTVIWGSTKACPKA
jgi:hypothetical protein